MVRLADKSGVCYLVVWPPPVCWKCVSLYFMMAEPTILQMFGESFLMSWVGYLYFRHVISQQCCSELDISLTRSMQEERLASMRRHLSPSQADGSAANSTASGARRRSGAAAHNGSAEFSRGSTDMLRAAWLPTGTSSQGRSSGSAQPGSSSTPTPGVWSRADADLSDYGEYLSLQDSRELSLCVCHPRFSILRSVRKPMLLFLIVLDLMLRVDLRCLPPFARYYPQRHNLVHQPPSTPKGGHASHTRMSMVVLPILERNLVLHWVCWVKHSSSFSSQQNNDVRHSS